MMTDLRNSHEISHFPHFGVRGPVTRLEHTAPMPAFFLLCPLLRRGREGRDKEPVSNHAGLGGAGLGRAMVTAATTGHSFPAFQTASP